MWHVAALGRVHCWLCAGPHEQASWLPVLSLRILHHLVNHLSRPTCLEKSS